MKSSELLKHMRDELFVPALAARTKDDALRELTDAIVAGSDIKDPALVLEMLRNREQLGSTALEPGVAFPHGRSLAVKKLTLLVARSSDGVDFESEDGKPTHLFFVLLAPPQDSGNLYLQALGRIASLVREPGVRDRMMSAAAFDEFALILGEAE